MITLNSECINDLDRAIQVMNELRRAIINGTGNSREFKEVKFSLHVYDVLTQLHDRLETLKFMRQTNRNTRTLRFSDTDLCAYLNSREYEREVC